jgi:DNA-binding beta-propeller fold protein YncE
VNHDVQPTANPHDGRPLTKPSSNSTRLRTRQPARRLVIGLTGTLALLGAGAGTSVAATSANGAQRGSIVLSGSPGVPVANPNTGTVYVPIQCKTSFCSTPAAGRVVDVINAARCNANVVEGCRVVAKVTVGKSPLAAVIDEHTDTIYVVNGSGSVSVVNGNRCNARLTSGCKRAVATVKTGGFPVAGAFDPKTRTLYAASPAGQVFVINVANCNAITTRGCRQRVRKVKDSGDPQAIDVDLATDTVYAANAGPTGNGDTVSVIDGATCNGTHTSGCGRTPRTIKVGGNPFWDAVDQATNTVYVANFNDGTVSVINGARCNAKVSSGCKRTAPAVTTGAGAGFVAIDSALHTAFVLNGTDDTLSAIDTRRCKGTSTGGCPRLAPAQQPGSNLATGYAQFPTQFALIPRTGSAYMVNVGGSDVLAIVDVRHCDAVNTSACRVNAASVPDHEYLAAIDPATNTIYASNLNLPQIDVLNGATCHSHDLSGCAPVGEIRIGHADAGVGAIDDANRTLYAADGTAGTISLVNTTTCNATDTASCSARPPTITLGPSPGIPVLNPATQTLYTVVGKNGNQVSALDAATCNAQTVAGCGQTPGVVTVGPFTSQLAVSAATDTIYAPSAGQSFSGDTVAVIDGATCSGTDHSGCGQPPATVTVGLGPDGAAVDDLTHTLYVANNANGDFAGTVSVINTATCNGADMAGCAGHMPTVPVGRSSRLVAVDTSTNRIYITNYSSASVSVIDGTTCNAEATSGCAQPAPQQAVGSQPNGLAVNDSTNTVYALTQLGPGATSIFGGAR